MILRPGNDGQQEQQTHDLYGSLRCSALAMYVQEIFRGHCGVYLHTIIPRILRAKVIVGIVTVSLLYIPKNHPWPCQVGHGHSSAWNRGLGPLHADVFPAEAEFCVRPTVSCAECRIPTSQSRVVVGLQAVKRNGSDPKPRRHGSEKI